MKVFNKLAMLAAGVMISFGVMQEAQAAGFNQIVNIDALQNTTSNPISLNLSAGTYSVDYIGMNNGGAYDAWNAWGEGRVSQCDSNGEGCRTGWLNNYSISFDGFNQTFATGRYANALQAMQNALSTSFTLASDTTVNFFVKDSHYRDNVGGVSLNVSSQSVPEPASMLGFLAVGTIGVSQLKRKKQVV